MCSVFQVSAIEFADKLYPIVKDRCNKLDNEILEKIVDVINTLAINTDMPMSAGEYNLNYYQLIDNLSPILMNGFKSVEHLKLQLNNILNAICNATIGLKIKLYYPKRIRKVPDRLTY
jgi:hypothetical protein